MTAHAARYPSRLQEASLIERSDPVIHNPDAQHQGPLSPAQLQQYREQGFLFMPELFIASEVETLVEEMQALRRHFSGSGRPEVIVERDSQAVRSIFNVHRIAPLFGRLARYPRLINVARQILGSEVYIHQSRINYKPGFRGKDFFWHSDFETWHIEDGMPAMRALSCAISLTPNNACNGPVMVIPGSHRYFISCAGTTPNEHYKTSLQQQQYGVPDDRLIQMLVQEGGIEMPLGPAGSVLFFDCNLLHGSNSNISPWPRSNIFLVYNSVHNALQQPAPGLHPRPEYIAARHHIAPLAPLD